jgi:hypothetical protein
MTRFEVGKSLKTLAVIGVSFGFAALSSPASAALLA